jgi:hypothetical protein
VTSLIVSDKKNVSRRNGRQILLAQQSDQNFIIAGGFPVRQNSVMIKTAMKYSAGPAITAAVLLCSMLLSCSQPGGPEIPGPGGEVAALVNDHRISKGLQSLKWSHDVYLFAQAYADDAAEHNLVPNHYDSNGVYFNDRIAASSIVYSTAGENAASGFITAVAVTAGWIGSAGHLANIENPAFTNHGVGYNPDGHYWVHVFIGN